MATYCFDIDGTLCSQEESDYLLAIPDMARVAKINQLKSEGNVVKIFTARGSKSGIDWRERTEKQLSDWGLQYDELILGKPHADYFVDDKAVFSEAFDWKL